jgi:hypothetical protein
MTALKSLGLGEARFAKSPSRLGLGPRRVDTTARRGRLFIAALDLTKIDLGVSSPRFPRGAVVMAALGMVPVHWLVAKTGDFEDEGPAVRAKSADKAGAS